MITYAIQDGFSVAYEGNHYQYQQLATNEVGEEEILLKNIRTNYPVALKQEDIYQKVNKGEMKVLTSGHLTKPGDVANIAIQKSAFQLHYEAQVYAYCNGLAQRGITKGMRKQIQAAIVEISKEIADKNPPSTSTVMRWMRKTGGNPGQFQHVTENFLLQKRASRKSLAVITVAKDILSNYYFIPKTGVQKPDDIETCTGRINVELKKLGIDDEISMSTVKRMIARVPVFERDCIRLGVAEAKYKHRHSSGGKWPTKAFERVELDHTVLDLRAVDRLTGKTISRPTITVLKDRYTGYILSMWIGYEGESIGRVVRAISCALQDKKHLKQEYGLENKWLTPPRIWETLVLDNAWSHHSDVLHSMAKNLGFSIEFSAVRSPWEKGSVENWMLQLTRALPHHGRPIKPNEVKSKQAKKLAEARVYFDDLVKYLHQFVVDYYPNKLNKRTDKSPYSEMLKAIREHDHLPKIYFAPLSDELRILTGQKMEKKIKQGGIVLGGLTYRSRELSEIAQLLGVNRTLSVSQDVNDVGEIFVLNPQTNKWISVPEMDYEKSKGKPRYKHKFEQSKSKQDLITNGLRQKDWEARIAQSNAVTQLVADGRATEIISPKEAKNHNITGANPNGDRDTIDVQAREIGSNSVGRGFIPETAGKSNNKLID